jgi:hypothetical protein
MQHNKKTSEYDMPFGKFALKQLKLGARMFFWGVLVLSLFAVASIFVSSYNYTSALWGYYTMNESATLPIDSYAGHNITTRSGANWSQQGILGNSYCNYTALNGNLLRTTDVPIMSGNITMNIWINQTEFTSAKQYGLMTGTADGTADSNFGMVIYTNKLYYFYMGGRVGNISSDLSGYLGKWTMITLVRYSSGVVNGYVNGVFTGSASGTSLATTGGRYLNLGTISSYGYALYGCIDEASLYDRSMEAGEINNLYNLYLNGTGFPFTGSAPPPVVNYTPTFFNQTPSDINTLNLFGTRLNITYLYNDTNISNTSSIILNYTLPRIIYSNGSAQASNYQKAYSYITATTGGNHSTYMLNDNDVYPATYNTPEGTMDDNTHTYIIQNATSDLWKIELLNVSNLTAYNLYEVMLNNTGTEEIYYCNSSYSTGQPQLDANCNLFSSFSGTGFNHSHNNSKHNTFFFSINTTAGTIGSVKITSQSFFVLKRLSGVTNIVYLNQGIRTNSMALSLNNGNTYTANNTISVDMHLHQYGLQDNFSYNACYTNNTGTQICSASRTDTYDISPLPPTSPAFLSPENIEFNYLDVVPINWSASVPFNSSTTIQGYNISLLNDDYSYNTTIIYTTNTQNYYIAGEVTTTGHDYVSSYGLMANITITNNNRLVNNVTYQQKSSSGNSRIFIRYIYANGDDLTTSYTQADTSYVSFTSTNLYPYESVARIEIYGGTNSAGYNCYYKTLSINYNGYAPNNQYNWTQTFRNTGIESYAEEQPIPIGDYKIKIEGIDSLNSTNYAIGDAFNITSLIELRLKNAYTGNSVSNFSGWIYNFATGINQTFTASGDTHSENIYAGLNTIYVEHPLYSIGSSNYYNLTINNTGATYYKNFSLFTANSIYIQIKDESTYNLINQSIVLEVQYLNTTINTTSTSSGIIFLEDLSDGEYTLVFTGDYGVNYTTRTYVVNVAENSSQYLTAYLTNSGTSVLLTILDSYSSGLIEGASVSLYRYINSTYTLVEIKNSDITGRAQFVYIPLRTYRFVVQKTGYTDKIFDLNPIIFSSYNVPIDRAIAYIYTGSQEDVQITYSPHYYWANESINFTWIISSPDGVLSNYGVNLSYPCGNKTFTGNNSIGETYTTTFSITCAGFRDTMNVTYFYESVGQPQFTYREYFFIGGTYSGSNYTWVNLGRNSDKYGLGDLERIFIVTLLVLIVAGTTYLMVGGIGALAISILMFGYFSWTGFIPFWSIAISVIAGVFLLIGGKE